MIGKVKIKRECSIRRCCSILGFRRQTYYKRLSGHRPEELDRQIADLLHQVATNFVAWRFWIVFHFLRRQGHPWNHTRVYRVWKKEELHLRKSPKRSRIKRKYRNLLAPSGINEGWAMDFLSDWVVGPEQEKVRIINIMDECSRKGLWTEAHTSISAKTLTAILDKVVEWRGCPSYIRCDNGPEFISDKLAEWAVNNKVEIRFIQPGKPTQNGLIERLNGTLRRECLNLEWFESIPKLNQQLQEWWQAYNTIRPHSSIGFRTPDEEELLNKNFYYKPVAA